MRKTTAVFARRGLGVLAAGALAFGVTACSADAGDTDSSPSTGELRTVTITQALAQDFAPAWIADEMGFFEEEGIQAEFAEAVPTGAAQVAQISSGQVDLVPSSVSAASLARAQGVADLRAIVGTGAYPTDEEQDPSSLIVLAGSDITRPADLSGKTVGVFALGGTAQSTVAELIDNDGGDWTTVEFIQVPNDSAGGLLQSGEIAAAYTFSSTAVQLIDSGDFSRLSVVNSLTSLAGVNAMSLWSTPEWIAENEDVATSVRAAIAKAVEWAVDDDNREALDQLISEHIGTDVELLASLPRQNYQATISEDDIVTTQEQMIQYGVLEAKVDVDSFVWEG